MKCFSHHPAPVRGARGGGQELCCPVGQPSLAGTVTVGWRSGVLPTLHILPALVFSCPAVSRDNNLLSCLGPWPRSGSAAGCWHGRPALPGGLNPGRDQVGVHGLGGDLGCFGSWLRQGAYPFFMLFLQRQGTEKDLINFF